MNQYTFEIQKPVVQTKFGQLRGVTYGDVNIFMGIPYARAKRFHMPEEPQAWTGIKNAYTYGPITPQMLPPNPPPCTLQAPFPASRFSAKQSASDKPCSFGAEQENTFCR